MGDKELVARLRVGVTWSDGSCIRAVVGEVNDPVMAEAADRIEALTARLAEAEALAEALRLVSKRCGPRSQDGAIAAAALKAWEDTDAPR